jgi:hypothetical protein
MEIDLLFRNVFCLDCDQEIQSGRNLIDSSRCDICRKVRAGRKSSSIGDNIASRRSNACRRQFTLIAQVAVAAETAVWPFSVRGFSRQQTPARRSHDNARHRQRSFLQA